ncbi:hypothetical protein BGLA2_850010 [Burkholderia gladioli]|nr:hypothetical protein BGLA2_850010 [Burkholderia gladioli]
MAQPGPAAHGAVPVSAAALAARARVRRLAARDLHRAVRPGLRARRAGGGLIPGAF